MLYLLDTNVLIDAKRDYYPFEVIPDFWEWLELMGTEDKIKIPYEIYIEISNGSKTDPLVQWFSEKNIQDALILDESPDPTKIQHVLNNSYASDLNDVEIEEIGYDPFLIAYCLNDPNRCVVTTERSKNSQKRAKRRVPDACTDLGVTCIHTFSLIKQLNFTTKA